jgi:hypothetical protein
MTVGRSIAIALLAVAVASPPGSAAATDAARCAAAKLRVAGQKAKARLYCYGRGALAGATVDALCLAKVESKFAAAWARIEGHGGCATTNDAGDIEGRVDDFAADVAAALAPATATTVVTTSTCPPTTAFYCGSFCPTTPGIVALCPAGTTCVITGPSSCECQGAVISCGSLVGNFCRWGACPAGTTCMSDSGSTSCPPSCSCQ